ncbi:protein kinase superfamily protein [Actinidia rufa]|uniref:Protein kinase superfamily protein n=1 Tax=Actinidia rufa TaxID=165716 RepID=A0A7J0H9G3_9ERIC|nr:protein kinase superfamily protein [Actinidia rufa]
MDLKSGEGTGEGVKAKEVGSISSNDMFFRADKIDFKSWDVQLEKHLSRVWSRDREVNTKKEVWEIDLAKLDTRSVIAHGTYGTVYRGVYDGQDVAVKVLDWGEDGIATVAETAALRASFRQEVAVWQKLDHPNVTKFIGASMGTSNLKIPSNNTSSDANNSLPSRACCVVVEYLPGGTLKKYLIRNCRKKLSLKVVIQLALDLSRGSSMASLTTGNVTSKVLAYAYGKSIAVTCLILILALLKYLLQSFDSDAVKQVITDCGLFLKGFTLAGSVCSTRMLYWKPIHFESNCSCRLNFELQMVVIAFY